MDRVRQLLSTNMKAARKRLGHSQQKLAELCDVSTSYIGEIEIGRKFPSSGMLVRIAQSLEVQPYRLLFDPRDEDTVMADLVVDEFRAELMDAVGKEADRLLLRYARGKPGRTGTRPRTSGAHDARGAR